jgi:signal transduction histidine kinase
MVNRRGGSFLAFLGFMALFIGTITHIMYIHILAISSNWFLVGVLGFIFFQSLLLSRNHLMILSSMKKKGEDLAIANTAYERELKERRRIESDLIRNRSQLRALSSELMLTEQRERRKIAGELHDHIGHLLSNAAIRLGILKKSVEEKKVMDQLNMVHSFIDQSIQGTQSLIFEISPPILYDMGLEAALEWLMEKTEEQYGLRTGFQSDANITPIEEDLRVLIFQLTRELVFNAVKHAKAENLQVSVKQDEENIKVNVTDDGIGFDSETIGREGSKSGGFGLFSIRERIKIWGGTIEIDSQPNKGTSVTMTISLRNHMDNEKRSLQ